MNSWSVTSSRTWRRRILASLPLLAAPLLAALAGDPAACRQDARASGLPVAGRVLVAGRPAAGVRVYSDLPPYDHRRAAYLLAGKLPPESRESVAVAADGGFRLAVQALPQYRVVAVHGELRFERRMAQWAPDDLETLDIPLPGRIFGQVVDSGGVAVAGAVVWLEKEDFPEIAPWQLGPLRAVSDAQGRFELPAYPASRLGVLAPSFAPASWQIGSLATAPARYVLAESESRRVTVYRAPGAPAADVLVESAAGEPLGFTDEKGRLAFRLPAGEGLAFAAAAGVVAQRWQIAEPRFADGELATLVGGKIYLEGRLLASGGEPSRGAAVDLFGEYAAGGRSLASTASDAAGRWRLGPVEADGPAHQIRDPAQPIWRLRFRAAGHADSWLDVYATAAEPGLFTAQLPEQQLRPELELRGRVIDAAERGIAGAEIHLWRDRQVGRRGELEAPDSPPAAVADEEGRFSIGGLAFGEQVAVEARAPDFVPRLRRDLAAGGADVELLLESGVPVEVRVMDQAGRPAPSMWVFLVRPGEMESEETPRRFFLRTGDDGLVVLPRVPAGEFQLKISGPGFLSAERPVVVGEERLRLEQRLARGAVVEGFVLDAEGEPAAGAQVEYDSALDQGAFQRADERGFYRISGLHAGPLTLAATYRSAVAEGSTELRDGAVTRLDLRISRPLMELRGVLVDLEGKPLARRSVSLEKRTEREDGQMASITTLAFTAADGSFSFPIAQARTYILAAYRDGEEELAQRSVQLEVDMTRSQTVRLVLP